MMLKKLKIKRYFINNVVKNYSKKFYNLNEVEAAVINSPIRNNTILKVGGYLNSNVPNNLLNALFKHNCKQITVITNVSINENVALNSLFNRNDKIQRLITSLNDNYDFVIDYNQRKKNVIQCDYLSNIDYLNKYCLTNTPLNNHISLIKAPFVDLKGKLVWKCNQNQCFYNDLFAKNSSFTIAEVGSRIENDINVKDVYAWLPEFYTNKIVINKTPTESESNHIYANFANNDLASTDRIRTVIKRLLTEFENNSFIYISNGVFNDLIRKFYMPTHLNLILMNDYINRHWPSNFEWINCLRKLDLCVIEVEQIDKQGRVIKLNDNGINSCTQDVDIVNNSNSKLIFLIRELSSSSIINENKQQHSLINKIPDLIISDKAVFKIDNRNNNEIKLIECIDEFLYKNDLLFEFKINISNSIKSMIQSN